MADFLIGTLSFLLKLSETISDELKDEYKDILKLCEGEVEVYNLILLSDDKYGLLQQLSCKASAIYSGARHTG